MPNKQKIKEKIDEEYLNAKIVDTLNKLKDSKKQIMKQDLNIKEIIKKKNRIDELK